MHNYSDFPPSAGIRRARNDIPRKRTSRTGKGIVRSELRPRLRTRIVINESGEKEEGEGTFVKPTSGRRQWLFRCHAVFKRSFVRDSGNWMIILELFLASTGSSVITGCRIVTDLLRLDCPGGDSKDEEDRLLRD